MTRHATIFFIVVLYATAGWSQGGWPASTSTPGRTDTVPGRVEQVLIATNEDCEIFINNAAMGSVSKNEFRHLRLEPGTYRVRARSKATGDELTDAFTVTENGPNEVFLDVLYAVDENAAQRIKATGSTTPTLQPGGTAVKNNGATPVGKSFKTKEEAEQETVLFFLTNMAYMKGGTFVMGNNRAPSPAETEHTVTLSPFYFCKYEVTQHQWETIMGPNPSLNKDCPTCPVENVSWEDAVKFTQRISALSKRTFRLPTEAEWEYAARVGGRAEVDSAGGQEEFIKKTAWFFSNAAGRPRPVGVKQPTVAGVFDLTGNVSEWCLDWYGATYYKEAANRRNPRGPSVGKEKVVRGGNFKDYVGDRFRPSFRNRRVPTARGGELGFRLVMEAGE